MKPLATLLLIFLTAWTAGFSQSEAVKLKEKADFAAARDKYLEAIQLYSKAIEYDKKYYEAYFKRGVILARSSQHNKAEADFKIALKGKYRPSDCMFHLGQNYFNKKEYEESKIWLEKCINLDPGSVYAFIIRGKISLLENDVPYAIRCAESALKNDSTNPEIHCYLGRWLFIGKDTLRAEPHFLKAVELEPNNDEFQYFIGYLYGRTSREELAILHFKKAMAINPYHKNAAASMGYYLSYLGRHEEAVEELSKFILKMPKEPFLRNNYGYALYKTGKVEEGMDQIYRSQKLDPTNSWVNRNLAEIFLEQGDTAKACAEIEKGIELGFKELYGDELERMKAEHCK